MPKRNSYSLVFLIALGFSNCLATPPPLSRVALWCPQLFGRLVPLQGGAKYSARQARRRGGASRIMPGRFDTQVSADKKALRVNFTSPDRYLQISMKGHVFVYRESIQFAKWFRITPSRARSYIHQFRTIANEGYTLSYWRAAEQLAASMGNSLPVWEPQFEPPLGRVRFLRQFELFNRDGGESWETYVITGRPGNESIRLRSFDPETGDLIRTIFMNRQGEIQINDYKQHFATATAINPLVADGVITQFMKYAAKEQLAKLGPLVYDCINKFTTDLPFDLEANLQRFDFFFPQGQWEHLY